MFKKKVAPKAEAKKAPAKKAGAVAGLNMNDGTLITDQGDQLNCNGTEQKSINIDYGYINVKAYHTNVDPELSTSGNYTTTIGTVSTLKQEDGTQYAFIESFDVRVSVDVCGQAAVSDVTVFRKVYMFNVPVLVELTGAGPGEFHGNTEVNVPIAIMRGYATSTIDEALDIPALVDYATEFAAPNMTAEIINYDWAEDTMAVTDVIVRPGDLVLTYTPSENMA